ncbi:MAG: phosphate acyltransferase PlsX, partial [Cyanobacteriota bacterium]
MPPKDPDHLRSTGRPALSRRQRPNRTIRRLVIWYKRNAAVTSLVDTASAAGSVAGVAAGTVLQPLVLDPLRRLQQGTGGPEEWPVIDDRDRFWVAVDGMGGDHAPGPILEGCLRAVRGLPLRIRCVAEVEPRRRAVASRGLGEDLEEAQARGL